MIVIMQWSHVKQCKSIHCEKGMHWIDNGMNIMRFLTKILLHDYINNNNNNNNDDDNNNNNNNNNNLIDK